MVKTLEIDLETSPVKGYWWHGMHEVNPIKIIEESRILCYAYRWLGEKKIHVVSQPMFCTYKKDMTNNTLLTKELHKLLSQADYVMGHNLTCFDDKVANKDFAVHELGATPRHRTIDTLRIARTNFRFNSNKLDDLAQLLGVGRKLKHPGFPMWEGCMAGDKASWKLMERYNKHDIFLLEGVWDKLKSWHERPPLPRLRKHEVVIKRHEIVK